MQEISTPLLVSAVALIGPAGTVFMQRRHLASVHGGLWEFPGGKAEAGEHPEATAIRELAEELGIHLRREDLVPAGFAAGQTHDARRTLVILLYACRRWQGEPHGHEAEETGWFDPAALAGLAMPPLDYPLAAQLHRALVKAALF
ncbi:NUDIX domain-containing protein [Novosphingobium album (ex Liu et al. 2023)]|uniref:8-oxo-dGTP diphosphatase n=1 Tax=Novosphingobium album (ex Liu et al. 2023) TaxID=3031130 RepID=A0ABT5WWX2_9SPHN|nr:(deoxy)nucleoside triphosphate pyrophosphohydrolase [Novosphingobium album (ex Liu et al. 2023)]MDE8654351.1 (deoxy)nucleoside triphosphate pyrophosphohydrolase [Novosphingobium album (ex Liu et al. 2023)]